MYERNPRLPSDSVLHHVKSPYNTIVHPDDYRTALTIGLSEAWSMAQEEIKFAQEKQKLHYDKYSKESRYKPGDRVMVYMPNAVQGKAWKIARPFYEPYRVLNATPTNVEVKPVDKPDVESIFIALDRVRPCFPELPDVSWCENATKHRKPKMKLQSEERSSTP